MKIVVASDERTILTDFVESNAVLLEEKDLQEFNSRLMDWLLWYNTQRPHNSLGNQVPMKFVVDYLQKSNMYGTGTAG